MATYQPENSQENSKKSTQRAGPLEKTEIHLRSRKKHISSTQWDQNAENQKSYKNNSRIAYWTNNYKATYLKHQECCGKRYNRIITDYGNPNKIKMLRKMDSDWAQKKSTKNDQNCNGMAIMEISKTKI